MKDDLAKVEKFPEIGAVLDEQRLFWQEICLETFARLPSCEFSNAL